MKKNLKLLVLFFIILSSCEMQDDMSNLIISEEISAEYLIEGDLDVLIQGEQVFREKGKPGIVSIPIGEVNLNEYEDCFILYISNGSESVGTVTSAILTLDGQELLNTSDFSGTGVLYDFEICNLTNESILEVEVRGEPGTYIEIWLEGKRKCFECGDFFIDERDGKAYKTVQIGEQCWMAENLKYIPEINNPYNRSYTEPRYYIYDFFSSNRDSAITTEFFNIYGVFYNFTAALNASPSGWHLPSDEEWKQLEMFLGMSRTEADYVDIWRGDGVGGKLKEIGNSHWNTPNEGATNEIGFTALPAGQSHREGHFDGINNITYFWSSTIYSSTHSFARRLDYDKSKVLNSFQFKTHAYVIRCIKDEN